MNRTSTAPLLIGFLVGAIVVGVPFAKYTYDQNKSLDAEDQRVMQLQQTISRLQIQSTELVKRDLPVRVGLHKALFSAGKVLRIQNISGNDLPVSATFSRTGMSAQTQELVIPANGIREIGERQGWAFVSGDSVVLQNPTYRDWHNPSLP